MTPIGIAHLTLLRLSPPEVVTTASEAGYDFVRRSIVYETLGKREGEKWVPLMVSLFFFIWIMNIWSVIPLAQFPVSSIIAYPMVLAAIVYITWVALTFKHQTKAPNSEKHAL